MLLEMIKGLIKKEYPLYTNLSSAASILYMMENINWAGFYIAEKDTLYVGPYQGELACIKIDYGKGVCGTAFKEKRTIIVDDVNKFKGHIACSSKSKSEIVVPIIKDGNVKAVIDIDAPIYNRFSTIEQEELEKIAEILGELF